MSKEVNFKSIYFVRILRQKLWCRGKGGTVLHKCGCIALLCTQEQVQAELECSREVQVLATEMPVLRVGRPAQQPPSAPREEVTGSSMLLHLRNPRLLAGGRGMRGEGDIFDSKT